MGNSHAARASYAMGVVRRMLRARPAAVGWLVRQACHCNGDLDIAAVARLCQQLLYKTTLGRWCTCSSLLPPAHGAHSLDGSGRALCMAGARLAACIRLLLLWLFCS